MNTEFGFKELEQVIIKTTYPIEINGKTFIKDETVAAFDKIQIANFNEIKSFVSANGGFDNRAHVWWESTKELQFNFVQGIFSKTQFALMNNAKLFNKETETLLINERELVESDENGIVQCSHIPVDSFFMYDEATGQLINDFVVIDEQTVRIDTPFKNVLLDYPWEYKNGFASLSIGNQLSNGTFVLTGRTRVKDDITGQIRTGIVTIPKLKLMSDLSMRLGSDANPIVGRLDAIACPVGLKGKQQVLEINFLNDNIDSDM